MTARKKATGRVAKEFLEWLEDSRAVHDHLSKQPHRSLQFRLDDEIRAEALRACERVLAAMIAEAEPKPKPKPARRRAKGAKR